MLSKNILSCFLIVIIIIHGFKFDEKNIKTVKKGTNEMNNNVIGKPNRIPRKLTSDYELTYVNSIESNSFADLCTINFSGGKSVSANYDEILSFSTNSVSASSTVTVDSFNCTGTAVQTLAPSTSVTVYADYSVILINYLSNQPRAQKFEYLQSITSVSEKNAVYLGIVFVMSVIVNDLYLFVENKFAGSFARDDLGFTVNLDQTPAHGKAGTVSVMLCPYKKKSDCYYSFDYTIPTDINSGDTVWFIFSDTLAQAIYQGKVTVVDSAFLADDDDNAGNSLKSNAYLVSIVIGIVLMFCMLLDYEITSFNTKQ